MELCPGVLLTIIKHCKSPRVRQKQLGKAIFSSLQPGFDMEDDDTGISAIFRGARNLDSYIQLNCDEMDHSEIAIRIKKMVIPLLDRNKWNAIVCAIKQVIEESDLNEETVVELLNKQKCKDVLSSTTVVFSELLTGLLIYVVTYTDNYKKESTVKMITKKFIDNAEKNHLPINFVESYSLNCLDTVKAVTADAEIMNLIVQEGGNCVVCGKPLEKTSTIKALTPNGTTFLVCMGCAPKITNATLQQEVEYKRIKKQLQINVSGRNQMALNHLGEDVKQIIRAISKLDLSTASPSRMNPLTVEQKVSDTQLRRTILHDVNDFYSDVDAVIRAEASAGRLNIRSFERVIKRMYEDREEESTESDIYNTLVDLIYEQTGYISREACRIVVSFFVQRCEVFG